MFKNNFCGRVKIGGAEFICSVTGHIVTVLPACQEDIEKLIPAYAVSNPEYIVGVDENSHLIALLVQKDIAATPFAMMSSRFFATIMLQSTSNTNFNGPIDKFDAISFTDGTINTVYNPKIAALERVTEDSVLAHNQDGVRTIKVKPFKEYTHSAGVTIDGENARLIYTITQSGGEDDLLTTSLGSLVSMIRLEFGNPQDLLKISRYYTVIKSLLAFCVKQNNVIFDVALLKKNSKGQYAETEICKIYNGYEDYCEQQFHNVIPISAFQNNLAKFIEIICDGGIDHLTVLLPKSNKNLSSISITNIQDLCTALEIEYNLCEYHDKSVKDSITTKLKDEIKKAIKNFIEENTEIDVYQETTISSCFQYLDFTLKDKILFLYCKHQTAVDAVIEKWKLPSVDISSVGNFVKLRNNKTHSGIIDWGESASIYSALLSLVYACTLQRIGFSGNDIEKFVLQIF